MRIFATTIILTMLMIGCPKNPISTVPQPLTPEQTAYYVVVGSKAFLTQMKSHHPECAEILHNAPTTVCTNLTKATAAKDALIAATKVYCAGPKFLAGGACDAPSKGTPANVQAQAKLNAAISNYSTIETELRTAVGGK